MWEVAIGSLILAALLKAEDVVGDVVVGPSFNKYDDAFRKAATKHGVPWRWLKAFAMTESSLGDAPSVKAGAKNPKDVEASKSSDGKSWGLMQVTLKTAQWLDPSATVEKLNNAEYSIDLGATYIRYLMRIRSDRDWVARAYNGGPGWEKTSLGPSLTAVYLIKWKKNLDEVMSRQPGPERSLY